MRACVSVLLCFLPQITSQSSITFQSVGLFVGVCMVFLFLAALLILSGELRFPWMRRTVLRVRPSPSQPLSALPASRTKS